MKRTELVLDLDLPAKTWELRSEKNRVVKRCRYDLTEELLTEAMENPKAKRIAFGEEAHRDLLRLMARPGLKTPSQTEAEEAANLSRDHRPPARPGTINAPRCGRGFSLGPFPWDKPDPPGTIGLGGAAS